MEPLKGLVPKPTDQLSPEELRSWVLELRALRDTPAAFRSVVELSDKEPKAPKMSFLDELL